MAMSVSGIIWDQSQVSQAMVAMVLFWQNIYLLKLFVFGKESSGERKLFKVEQLGGLFAKGPSSTNL